MKNVSKLLAIALTAAALLFTKPVKAQIVPANTLRFSIGPDAGIPTGNLRIGSTFVLGGNARLQYGITDNFAIMLTSGADHFFSKVNPASPTGARYDSFGIIPVKAGIKEFFMPHIYVSAEAGVGVEETDSGAGNTKFILSPALGYGCKHLDVSLRYENFAGQMDNYGFVALRVAYGFKFFK